MVLDENKIVNYLNEHVGGFITSYELIKITGAYDGNLADLEASSFGMFEMHDKVAEIARKNGFALGTAHHKKEPGGMAWGLPWNIDFKILKRRKHSNQPNN